MTISPLYNLLGPRRFRLLSLHAGEPQDLLRGGLIEYSLDDTPPYEALSYVWQQPLSRNKDHDIPSKVIIRPEFEAFYAQQNGNCYTVCLDGCTHSLTESLAIALWNFRYKDKSRLLWVDQVCIDQEDVDDKNQQVRLMGDIYSSAERVLVWLGEEVDGVEAIFRTIRAIPLPTMTQVDNSTTPKPNKDELVRFEDEVKLIDSEFYSQLRTICQLPWFRRVWVLQEVALNTEAIAFCGHHFLPLSVFSMFLYHLFQYLYKTGNYPINLRLFFDTAAYGRFASLSNRSGKDDLISLLVITEASFASDPRDKVYGLTSLLNDRYLELGFEPDYRLSTAQVFTHATLVHLKVYEELDILERSQPRRELEDSYLPSWVPNFTTNPERDSKSFLPYKYNKTWAFTAALNTKPTIKFPSATCLSLTGYAVSEIAYVLEPVPRYPDFKDRDDAANIYTGWKSYIEGFEASTPYPYGGGTYEHAYWHTVTTNIHTQNLKTSFRECPEITHRRATTAPELEEKMRINLRSVTEGRRLALTRDGALALCPAATEVGDIVSIFCGGRMPFILRGIDICRTEQKAVGGRAFLLVGECFVHGIMYGDAMKDYNESRALETFLLV